MAQIMAVAADTPTELTRTPFLVAQPIRVVPLVTNTSIYGVNLSAKDARLGTYQHWLGDGIAVAWNQDVIQNLANAHVDTETTPDLIPIAAVLRVVVKVNGVVYKRVANYATPSTGEFKTHTVTGKTTLTFGVAPVAGAKIEVFLAPAAGVTNGPALLISATNTALRAYEAPAKQVVVSRTNAFQLERLVQD